ncbi:response regulator [Sinorhizobium numidicum]|uniref:histidine kinase n=1 Tax=Sinorhizobium numidicum TaxID=680248 RepID=A0ABY8CXS7_9HYPH|nr:response regulator [Sinorhizobium numidicum]WEX75759.1 response regulator [Sinorhizobium numidicum]WEX81746.1 response regulator [Sinorhizobium numidicum]
MMKPEELDRQLLEMFTQEVSERASEIERTLLTLEETTVPDERRSLQEQILRTVHSLKGAAGLVQVRGIETICHWMEEVLSRAAREELVLDRQKLDLLLAATDEIAAAARLLSKGEIPSPAHAEGVLLKLQAAIASGGNSGGEDTKPPPSSVDPVPVRSTDLDGSMRVSAERLDILLYRSGELLACDAVVRRHAEQASSLREQARRLRAAKNLSAAQAASIESGLRELAASLRQDGRLMHSAVSALDQEVRRARTQPFSEACKGLDRIVRDMAAASGKQAELVIKGGEIEIDRSILAGLQDSLRHLVRNAIAHGVQSPEERRIAGKREKGRIVLAASVSGDRVQVLVEDDGRGLDTASLWKLADEAGLSVCEDEGQLLRRVFEPGVSTSTTVTRLSGRGMGLDIVRNAVEEMRGTAEVAQVPGGGAVFTLTLPLTLATVRALEVVAAEHVFAIDTASIQRVIRVSTQDLAASADRSMTTGSMRYIDLASWLGLRPASRRPSMDVVPAVVIGAGEIQTAVIVDKVAGEQELLARSLGRRLAKVRRYSGGMVLPDGRIALLLNAAAVAEAAMAHGAEPEPFPRHAGKAEQRKVLVVDDSKYIRTMVKLILEGAGYDVALAADGGEALKYLLNHGADIVVADVDMPRMDGFELTQAIRGSDSLASMPVILVTGRETPEDKVRGLKAGASAYLPKNQFDAHQFLEIIRQVA